MTIEEFADIIQSKLIIERRPNGDGKWCADFEGCEVRRGLGGLLGDRGIGETPNEAIRNYINRIKGKTIVFNYKTKNMRQFGVPMTLEFNIGNG